MELCTPGSKGHNGAVVVRTGANRCSLVGTCAANRIGAKHVAAWNIEQVDFATEPAVGEIASERTHRRTVTRDRGGLAKPEIRSGEVDYPVIGRAVECIHVEIEAAHSPEIG